MTSQEFVFWLNGFFEIADPKTMDEKQIQVIKDHIALVLNKVTPDRNKEAPKNPLEGNLTFEQWQQIIKGKGMPLGPLIEPFPQYPGVIPGISPLRLSDAITCTATGPLPDSPRGSADPFASPAFKAAFDFTKPFDPDSIIC